MTEQTNRVFIGVATAAAGVGMFVTSAVNRDIYLGIFGACLFIGGNQLVMWGKLRALIEKVNGPARAMWEDGVDYGRHDERKEIRRRTLRVVNLPDASRGDQSDGRRFFSS